MSKEKSRLFKEEAQMALAKGDWEKALENYQRHCAQDPEDLRSSVKVGELLERLGRKKEAALVYRNAAESYAKDGFLLQAISLNKMILRIDPSAREINDRLAQLYQEKTREARPFRSLPTIPLFSELKEKELQSLLERVQVKTFPKGDFICREGTPGDSLMIIIRGESEVRKKAAKEKEVWIRNLKEGDFLGEFGFFTDQKRHATVRTLTECEILEISKDELNEMIKAYPRVKEVLDKMFRRRVLDTFFVLSPLFSPLTPKDRDEVFRRFHPRKVPEKTFIFQQGDPPTSLYLVKSGEVEIFGQDRHGKKITFAKVKSGNFFGEVAPLLNQSRMAHAKTTQPAELLELNKEDLDLILRRFPALRSILKEISQERLARMKELLSHNAVEKAKEAMV
ncbi:MAG TPA: cyclic nucleotide-binding domain-containing protein [Thermodesulfobacteriota bacterium]|nr:cyclic nucleotide-binding domain-containing protein [Thermodesulfobacteriota bacterium]